MPLDIVFLKRRLAEGRKAIKRRRIIKGAITSLYKHLKRYVNEDIIVRAYVWETSFDAKVEIVIVEPPSPKLEIDDNLALEVAQYLP